MRLLASFLSLLRPVFRSLPLLPVFAGLVGAAEPAPTSHIGQLYHVPPGPWGEVEYTRIIIEPPDEFMAADYQGGDHATWAFPGYDQAKLDQLWTSAGVDAGQWAALHDPAVASLKPDGAVLHPSAQLVTSLAPASRDRIYNILAQLPGNLLYQMPFRFRADMVGEWLDDVDLPDPVIAMAKSLLYRRGNSMLFSDPDLVLPMLSTATERVRLIKTLSRKSTLLVRLRLSPASNVDALVDYWGRGPRRKDVKPLLQSLTRHREGIALDIAHLLPRFARGLLYTYPPRTDPVDQTLDCHWTSLNFFRDEADRRFGNIDFVLGTLNRDYRRVPPNEPRLFGDVLLFTRSDGEIVHSCVHIVDDIVFTKNGYSYQMPWVLSTIRDTIAAYPLDSEIQIHAFRRKE